MEIEDLYDGIQKNTPSYLKQAQKITYKLFGEYSTFYKFEYTRSEYYKTFDFYVIPMFDMQLRSDDFNPDDNILNYIKIRKKPKFSDIIILKEEQYYAIGSCTEYFPYSIMLPEKENGTIPSLMIRQLNLIKPYLSYKVFYVRGFLHTWWLVNNAGNVLVCYLPDNKFYEYDEFMNRYFSPELIKVILEKYYVQQYSI